MKIITFFKKAVDDFDILVKELTFEKRAKPTDRFNYLLLIKKIYISID